MAGFLRVVQLRVPLRPPETAGNPSAPTLLVFLLRLL